MLRIIGAILIIGGTAAAGLSASNRLKNRVSALSSLINALEIMQSEIYFKLTPLPEIISILAKNSEYPVSIIFKNCLVFMRGRENPSFAPCFIKAVNEAPPEFKDSEKQILLELSNVLGRYDVEGQSRAINYAVRRFEVCLREARDEFRGQSKVYRALGIVCGIVSVIILI